MKRLKLFLSIVLCCAIFTALCACAGSGDAALESASASADNQKPTVNYNSLEASAESVEEEFTNRSFIDDIKPYNKSMLRIAFAGDSITYGTGSADHDSESYPAQFSKLMKNTVNVGNFGKGSAYTLPPENPYNVKGTKPNLWYPNTAQYEKSIKFNPDIVVIMLGTNDFRSLTCEQAKADYKAALLDIAASYKELESVKKIYIATCIVGNVNSSIHEMTTGVLQELQKEAAGEGGYEVIDIYEMTKKFLSVSLAYTKDRLHPDRVGYGEIARAFYAFFKEQPFKPGSMGQSSSGVVYLRNNAASVSNADTPEKAIDSLSKAVGLLSETGGTVVLAGDYDLSYETVLPFTEKPIRITSVYDGKDYGGRLGLARDLYLEGEYIFEDIRLKASKENAMIVCGYHDLTIAGNVSCELDEKIVSYPGITAGFDQKIGGCNEQALSLHDKCNITIESGMWGFVRCGNTRSAFNLPVGTIDKGAVLNVNISGGSFENTAGGNLTAATGMNGVSGQSVLSISGGTFKGPVFALSRVGSYPEEETAYLMNGKAELNISGGVFEKGIRGIQDNSMQVSGEVVLNIAKDLASVAEKNGFTSVTER